MLKSRDRWWRVWPRQFYSSRLDKHWKELFLKLDKMPAGVGDKWLPGALVLIFDSDVRVRQFGEQMFRKRDGKILVSEFESDLSKPLMILIKRESEKACLTVTRLTLDHQPRFQGSRSPMERHQSDPSIIRNLSSSVQSHVTAIRSP